MRRVVMAVMVFSWSVLHLTALPAGAEVFDEGFGDAGSLPSTAMWVSGVGEITAITGQLASTPPGQDVYRICLAGGGTFSATTVGTPGVLENSQLALFDSSGRGVYANDDAGPDTLRSTLPAGHALTPQAPGIYYLAVTAHNDEALSDSGAIFPDLATGVLGPTGPGGGGPLTGWTMEGAAEGVQTYQIDITGAYACDSPAFCLAIGDPGPGALVGTVGHDAIVGTPGNDVIFALGGNDSVRGLGGHDIIIGGPGNDFLDGGDGDDIVCAGDGNDRLDGGNGDDVLVGGAGYDRLDGGPGNDRLFGGSENDQLLGGPGDDLLDGGPGANGNDGGPGIDFCTSPLPPTAVNCENEKLELAP